jgi:hypothetical protein
MVTVGGWAARAARRLATQGRDSTRKEFEMDRELIDALVERILDDVEQRFGVDDAWLLFCQGREAVWAWWNETPGGLSVVPRLAIASLHAKIQQRAATRRSLAA